ncbi:MAG: alpha-glucan family phosphorylase, partial [Elusimicrobiota bacterium]
QYLNFDGWQQEEYVENHFFKMPMQLVKDEKGMPLQICVEHPGGKVWAQIWKVQVGRVKLYLLDTDIDGNRPEDREITSQLYGGDREMRLRQETVLGIGGMRALKVLGYNPSVIHINEGHSAFLLFERIRMHMEEKGFSFNEAKELVKASCVFTTHTPVPAGNEVFSPELIEKYILPLYKKMGLTAETLLALGRETPSDLKSNFSMTVLALRFTGFANGVSRLHGTISRGMWQSIWPNVPRSDIPITSITNGIHANTWISYEMAGLFDRYIGQVWKDDPADLTIWQRVGDIPDAELWRSHERRRERLVSFARQRLKVQLIRRGESPYEINMAEEVLDPEALTIGFSRRFAGYKRGNLLFRDMDRLKKILTQKDRPVQLIIAGKAHPQDNVGKEVIKTIIHIVKDYDLRHKIVFIEDYDMTVAHYLVQGTDIWLNNPRRPAEASGTSGMKAAVNGVLNLSILDGWWCEGYNGLNGWIIGSGEEYADQEYQDEIESKAIYDILEKDIVPLYYLRGQDGLPRQWIHKMKIAMQTICPAFNSTRMIEEYTRKFYMPASAQTGVLSQDNYSPVKRLAEWTKKLTANWPLVKIVTTGDDLTDDIPLGGTFKVNAKIDLGSLKPEDVCVQVYAGYIDSKHRLSATFVTPTKLVGTNDNGTYQYEAVVTAARVGSCGYVVRVLPFRDGKELYIPGLITWQ